MKKIGITFFFMTLFLVLYGQEKPDWIDTDTRNVRFPATTYYTGFAFSNVAPDKSLQDITQQIKTEAQADLSKKIRLQITSQTQTNMAAGSVNGQYDEYENFFNQATTKSNTEVVDIKIESYYDSTTKIIYALAFVKRDDLSNFYTKQINLDLNNAETTVGISQQLAAASKKISARHKVEEAKQMLSGVNFYRYLLVAVDVNSNESSLQTERERGLLHQIEQMLIDLEQSTFIYMNCSYEAKSSEDDALNSGSSIFCNIIAQTLSENECSVTDNKEESDYELTLITSTTQRSNGQGEYGIISYYANVRGNLYNCATKKQVASFTIFNDPDTYAAGKSPGDAAIKAFKLSKLKDKVLAKILPKIKN